MKITSEVAELLLTAIKGARGRRELQAAFNGVCRVFSEPLVSYDDFDAVGTADICNTWADRAADPSARRLFAMCESRAYQIKAA